MAYFPCNKIVITLAILLVSLNSSSAHQLSTDYYHPSCPMLFGIVKTVVHAAIMNESRMGASLLRMHFHDCFVNGCDGSILLDDTPSMKGEKFAAPNNNSVRGYEVVDKIKLAVERFCPGVVSCADILAIAARDSVCTLWGPTWNVELGRRDGTTANLTDANIGLPSPLSNLTTLTNRFQALGLDQKDLVALTGAHSIGLARCLTFRDRLYNETQNLDPLFAHTRKLTCPPRSSTEDNDNLAPLDDVTPFKFDNKFFLNLVGHKGLLHSDQVLYDGHGGSTDGLVRKYVNNGEQFNKDFSTAMVKMGKIGVLTGTKGQIRNDCRKVNTK